MWSVCAAPNVCVCVDLRTQAQMSTLSEARAHGIIFRLLVLLPKVMPRPNQHIQRVVGLLYYSRIELICSKYGRTLPFMEHFLFQR